jgi:hydrogenase maturation protease
MKTLVLGLGNPILRDDGVGNRVAQELGILVSSGDITVEETSASGLSLLDILVGYDRAIIVDAIQTRDGKPGQIYRLTPGAFGKTRHASSPHDVNFNMALEMGHRMGMPMPREIIIYAIEAQDVSTFGEECTPEVREAIPECVNMVLSELNGNHQGEVQHD